MKRLHYFGLLPLMACLTMAIMMGGCKKMKLQHEIDRVNAKCPIDVGMAGRIYKVWLDDNTVVFEAQLNADLMNVEKLKNNPNVMKEASLLNVVDENQSVEQMIAEKVDLKYILTDSVSQEKLELLITSDELAKAYHEKKNDEIKFTFRRIDNQIAVTQLQLPMAVDEATMLIDFFREGDNAVYLYELNSDMVTLNTLDESLPMIKDNVSHLLAGNDPSVSSMVNLLIKANMGLTYRYRLGKTDKEFSFIPQDLKTLRNK